MLIGPLHRREGVRRGARRDSACPTAHTRQGYPDPSALNRNSSRHALGYRRGPGAMANCSQGWLMRPRQHACVAMQLSLGLGEQRSEPRTWRSPSSADTGVLRPGAGAAAGRGAARLPRATAAGRGGRHGKRRMWKKTAAPSHVGEARAGLRTPGGERGRQAARTWRLEESGAGT